MAESTAAPRYWLGGKRAAEQDQFFRQVLDARGWEAGDAENWDAGWFTGMPEAAQFKKVSPQRRLNHLPGNNALTVKSRLHHSLSAMRERLRAAYGDSHDITMRLDFFPRSHVMPRDYHALQRAALEDPEKRWILKPVNASKGKDIRVLRDVAEAPLDSRWMVQEYLAHPHTIRDHKYVLRLYVLVAAIEPLRVYLYRQGFAKLASEPYDINDADNPFSQLTNPDINALNSKAAVPVEFIDLERYRQWLRDQGHDDAQLFEKIRDLVTLTVISGVDAMRQRTAEYGADSRGCYELLGLDCMIDDNLEPWVLECNLSPSLGICAKPENGGLVEEEIKAGLVKDMISLIGLDQLDEAASEPARTPEALAAEAQAELARAGDFLRLYPDADPQRHFPCFSLPGLLDVRLTDGLAGHPLPRPRLTGWQVTEVFDESELALHATNSGHYYRLNDTAALIWLLATQGLEPDAIVEQLAKASQAPERENLEYHVWDCLSRWCAQGLLRQRGSLDEAPAETEEKTADVEAHEIALEPPLQLRCGNNQWSLHCDSAPVRVRLAALLPLHLAPLSEAERFNLPRLEILEDTPGYAVTAEGKLLASRLTLCGLGHWLIAWLIRQAPEKGQLAMDAAVLANEQGDALLCLSSETSEGHSCEDHGLEQLAATLNLSLTRGLCLEDTFTRAIPLGLPLTPTGKARPEKALSVPLPSKLQVKGLIQINPASERPAELSTLDALGVLLPACFSPRETPLDVAGLAEWLSHFPGYSLVTGLATSDTLKASRLAGEWMSIDAQTFQATDISDQAKETTT